MLSLLLFTVVGTMSAKQENAATQQVGNLQVKVEFYSPSIVRVLKTEVGSKANKKSYSVILKPEQMKNLKTVKTADGYEISSPYIKVNFNSQTGEIRFFDAQGNALLSDTKTTLEKRSDEANKGKWRIKQTFLLDKDEAVYGLGQLRDTHMNQRGRHITLWNNNTFIAIPYFTSEKGYGLYWDNAGKTYYDDDAQGTSFTSEVGTAADYYFMYKDGTQNHTDRKSVV